MAPDAALSNDDPSRTPTAGPPTRTDDDPAAPPQDDKDWTWVVARQCPECGFDPHAVADHELADRLGDAAPRWAQVLAGPEVGARPSPAVWSPLEYAAHVRDVYALFTERAALMLREDDPRFANWDQDAAARKARYWADDPDEVAAALSAGADLAARTFAGVDGPEWERTGSRSNGSTFTVRTLGVYFLHDVEHHLHDVGG